MFDGAQRAMCNSALEKSNAKVDEHSFEIHVRQRARSISAASADAGGACIVRLDDRERGACVLLPVEYRHVPRASGASAGGRAACDARGNAAGRWNPLQYSLRAAEGYCDRPGVAADEARGDDDQAEKSVAADSGELEPWAGTVREHLLAMPRNRRQRRRLGCPSAAA